MVSSTQRYLHSDQPIVINGSINSIQSRMPTVDAPVLLYTPPPPTTADELAIDRLAAQIEQKYAVHFDCYSDFHRWSCEHYDKFWEEVLLFTGIRLSQPYTQVVDRSQSIDQIPKWFVGARLNYAENCLLLNGIDDHIAIYHTREGNVQTISSVTFAELRTLVARYASALRACGVRVGDCVVGYMPNSLETAVAMLATASIGAVWSSASVDFGHAGVLDRFRQILPTVLFSVESVVYKGKEYSQLEKLQNVIEGLPSLTTVVVCPFIRSETDIDINCLGPKAQLLSAFLARGTASSDELFEQVPFDHPLFVMFSSGTTGAPKAMVHSVGGTLLKHIEEHAIQENMTSNDRILFWTTCGWMMWNWLMTALATGAALVLYEGSPFDPKPDILFDIADRTGTTIIGMGAKIYDIYEQKQLAINRLHELRSLRMVLSTGSPLKPACFDYIYEHVKSTVLVGSISGGTDIIACFMGVGIKHPVYRGEIQCLYLGMDMCARNEQNENVLDERGELVCITPFPSQPTHFIGDDADRSRYRQAYFAKYPGVWAHGDYCMISSVTGGVLMLGRSDGTLNPGGVRFGSAELYHIVEKFAEIDDTLVVGQRLPDDDERVVMFIKMHNGYQLDAALIDSIRSTIRRLISAKHIPAIILPIDDIPYTTSGKKVELAVKKILAGERVANVNTLRNPESLLLYERLMSQDGGSELLRF